jgi:hypothetical protein
MRDDVIVGHNSFKYKVNASWGNQPAKVYPVKDCHEMVLASNGLLYLLTNETHNNVFVYNKDGKVQSVWGNSFPGAHGLTISDENGEEFLYITDFELHKVFKTTLTGREILSIKYPKETGVYSSADQFKPTETAVGINGDIYITDGYGLQYIIQYDRRGKYIRHWGGRGNDPENFDCAHGIAIDNRNRLMPSLLITSRNENCWKRFTIDGKYISTIHLPGSFVCRPVIHKNILFGAVFRSGINQNVGSGYITILDESDTVVSTPGGSEPVYKNGKLLEQSQHDKIFIHPHDVCIDGDDNLYVPQWNSNCTYPVLLQRI